MVLTAVTNAEVAGKEARELTDEDVLGVLGQRGQEAPRGGRGVRRRRPDEQADKERAEAAVIAEYLPEQLSEPRRSRSWSPRRSRARVRERRHAARWAR